MKRLKPITTEYIRRFSILTLLALFSWMFFYSPSDIYNVQFQNYKEMYEIKIKRDMIDLDTSLEEYIERKMQGPYWHSSPKKINIVEVEGKAGEFLKSIISGNREDFKSNDHFFRENELPETFKSDLSLRDADYLSVNDEAGEKHYFEFYRLESNFMRREVPDAIRYPLENYAYLLILLSVFIYIFIPKPIVPKGAAYYTRVNAVYLPDVLGVFLWTGAWMFFFLPDDSAPMAVRYFLLLFFGIFALAIVLPTVKYASNWYLFTEDSFQWSDENGIRKVSLDDIVSVKPYKRQLPKWVAPLIILFGRGQPVATGAGMISMSSSPEVGMEITIKSGKRIRVMANYLEADKVFTKRFQELEHKMK
ncbi:hypothetical protein [Sulfurovum sp.]|uniref:hypothetical protein n=1 Tax=Sulfurovum sp. TaxID=1969726 RepID=UPI0025F50DA9|nr:hypothetical protein [Sulfurovum sp.]